MINKIYTEDWFNRSGEYILKNEDLEIGFCKTPDNQYSKFLYTEHKAENICSDVKKLTLEMKGMISALGLSNIGFKLNKKVETACTDGKVIYVGIGDNYNNISDVYEKLDRIIGMTIHECCHCLYTDFNYLKNNSAIKSQLIHHLHNIIEDEMIENRLCLLYPGYGNFLSKLKYNIFEKESENVEEDNSEINKILEILFYIIRYPKLLANISTEDFERYESLFIVIKNIMNNENCFNTSNKECTKSSVNAAIKIYDLLAEYIKENNISGKKGNFNESPENSEENTEDNNSENTEDNSSDNDNSEENTEENTEENNSGNSNSEDNSEEETEDESNESESNNGSGESEENNEEETDNDSGDSNGEIEDDETEEENSTESSEEENSDEETEDDTDINSTSSSNDSTDSENETNNSENTENESDEDSEMITPNIIDNSDSTLDENGTCDIMNNIQNNEMTSSSEDDPSDNAIFREHTSINGNNDSDTNIDEWDTEKFKKNNLNTSVIYESLNENKMVYNNYYNEIKSYIPTVKKIIIPNSKNVEMINERYRRNGSLDPTRLANAMCNEPTVYSQKSFKVTNKDPRYALVILLDESGSMEDMNINVFVSKLAIMIYESFKDYPNIELFIYGHGDCVYRYIDKTHKNKYVLGARHAQWGQNEVLTYPSVIEDVKSQTNLPIVVFNLTDSLYCSNEYDLIHCINTIKTTSEQNISFNLISFRGDEYSANSSYVNDRIYGPKHYVKYNHNKFNSNREPTFISCLKDLKNIIISNFNKKNV